MQRHQLCYHSLVSTNIKTSIRQQLEFEVPRNRKDQDGTNLGRNIIVDANVGFEFEGQKSNFILTRWRWNSLVSTANVSKMPSWDIIGKIMETKRRLDSLELQKKGHFAPKLVEDAMPVMSPRLLNSLLINWHLFKLVSLVFLEWIASIHWIPYSDFGCSLRGNERQIFPANYPAHTLIIRVECSW